MSPSYEISCKAHIWEATMLLTDALVFFARSKSGVHSQFLSVINNWSVKEMKDGLHPLILNLCIVSAMA